MAELLAIIEAISPGSLVIANELYPAALYFEVDTFGDSSLAEMYRLLRAAKTAGVRLHLVGDGDAATIGDTDADPLGGLIGDVAGAPYAGFLTADGT